VPGYRLLNLLEPARPRRVAGSPRALQLAVATVCVGAFMGQLDASIVSVALPRMSTDLHAGIGAVEWVSLAYVLTLVALVVPIGAWADAVGRKSLYVGGFAVFTIASAACAVAPDLAVLCALRVVQAVGAALMQANSVALIAAVTPRDRLGRMVGMQAAAQAIGLAAGPALGGLLLSAGSWRLLFLVNVPAGILGLVTAATLLPRSRDLAPARQIEVRGVVLFVPVIGLALLAMSLLAQGGSRLTVVGVAAGALVAAVMLVRQQRRTSGPLVPSAVVRTVGIRPSLVAAFCGYAVLFGTLVVVPLYLARAGLAGPTTVGLVLAALPVGIGLAAPIAGRMADRAPSQVARSGLLLVVAALAALAVARPSGAVLAALLGVMGLGLGTFTPANNRSLMLAAPAGMSGAVAGLLNMTRGLGTAAGTSIAVVAFTAAGTPGGGLTVALVALVVVGVGGLFAG
jgi:EmrB/QacA subfamily drug resistance transporter